MLSASPVDDTWDEIGQMPHVPHPLCTLNPALGPEGVARGGSVELVGECCLMRPPFGEDTSYEGPDGPQYPQGESEPLYWQTVVEFGDPMVKDKSAPNDTDPLGRGLRW